MDIAEASRFQRAPQTVGLAEHEQTGAIGIGRRRRRRNVFQNDPCRSGEEGLLFLSPGDERGSPAGLQHAETFAQRSGEIGKKHDSKAAGDNVVAFTGERERLGAGFAEFDVGDASVARQFFGKRNHSRTQVGRGHPP